MPLQLPVTVAVLLHLSSTENWSDFRIALLQMHCPFDLFINLVEGINSADELQRQTALIRSDFPDARINYSSNRGMDVGGMFRLFAEVIEGPYQALLYAHSKSANVWRKSLLQMLTINSTQALEMLNISDSQTNKKIGMIGAYSYPFDYYNLGPYLAILSELGVKVDSSWSCYFSRYPAMQSVSLEQRIAHARDIAIPGLRPELDLEYARAVLGDPDTIKQAMNPELLRKFIADKVISALPYFPGNFFWIAMPLVRKLSTLIDFEEEQAKLPLDLSSDRQLQSRAHAWERALPVFVMKNGYALHSLQANSKQSTRLAI